MWRADHNRKSNINAALATSGVTGIGGIVEGRHFGLGLEAENEELSSSRISSLSLSLDGRKRVLSAASPALSQPAPIEV
jgi:hypothetical protein